MTVWDREVDVVIAGYGLAGAVAACEAREAGASVLILEKAPWPGGNSVLSGGAIRCAYDAEAATSYLRQSQGSRVDMELIRTFALGMVENEGYIRKMARVDNAEVKVEDFREKYAVREKDGSYPPGAFPFAGSATYPFPGHETFYMVRIGEVPGFQGFPWVQRLKPTGTNLWKVAMDNVESRHIEVLLATPVERLIREAGGITGVRARSPAGEIRIGARRAVILACGGFEQNQWLLMQYLEGKPVYSMAPLTHTGDGVIMAQEVGAALWHMWHCHGTYGFKFPQFPLAFRHSISGTRNSKRQMPWIVVDKFGNRYLNEYPPAVQDTPHRAMQVFDPDMAGYPRIPSYMLFDEEGRRRGPIAKPEAIGENAYEWSQDNTAEISQGWILAAPTVGELALKIKETKDNEGKMNPEILEREVAGWNKAVKSGIDPFHRPAGTMVALEVPPFYAVPVWPVISNTQGGPQHDANQRVIDVFGQPIPHLYAVGELGSFFAHIYLQTGNLSECLISGRIAGRMAATEGAA